MNEDLYKGLPDEQKKQLVAAAADFEKKRWETIVADQKENEQKLVAAGAQIVPGSDKEIEEIAKVAREKVWPSIPDDVGKDWAQKILDKLAK